MSVRVLGIETDPIRVAEEDVAPCRGLSPAECYAQFVDLMNFTDILMRSTPVEEWYRVWRILDEMDDPGRWWERVPSA